MYVIVTLACANTVDALKFIQEFEKTMLDLWTLFKNSPKQLKTYIKTTLEARNFDQMSKRQKKKLVRKVKKAVRTRWLSLQASVYSVYQEYVWTNPYSLEYKRSTIRPSCKKAPKKIDSPEFLGTLYLLKFMLPHLLSYLSRTFQSSNLNFSRVSPNIHVTKTKLQETHAENKILVELDKDLGEDGRLSLCNITLSESTRSLIENQVKGYVEIISSNIDDRFPPESLAILEAFSFLMRVIFPMKLHKNSKSMGRQKLMRLVIFSIKKTSRRKRSY